MDFIKIENDGQKILETNYWQTEYAQNGYFYLSINAGCYRLLIPKNNNSCLAEIETAKEVVISRGPGMGFMPPKADMLEILFEDHTESPYVINIGPEQVERFPSDADRGWKRIFHVYCGNHDKPALEFEKVYYRKVNKIPFLKPVQE